MEQYHPEVMAKESSKTVTITAYVNSRGTISPMKTVGFKPIQLEVHENYYTLGPAGKALFRKNAYEALNASK